MTLLESITRAAADSDAGNLSPQPDFPIVLNPDEIIPNLKPESEPSGGASLVRRVTGWKISETDAEIAELGAQFSKDFKQKLKDRRSFDRIGFLYLLNSFLWKIAERSHLSFDSDLSDPSDVDYARAAIEKVGPLISRDVAGLITEGCVFVEAWELLETLILQGLVGHFNSKSLIEKLVEKNQSELLCLCVKHIPDLRSSEFFSLLKFFLSPSNDTYNRMVGVRKKWEFQALSAIEKATQKGVPKKASRVAKEASILLMMAYDGFSPSEMCLHYVFGSANLDGLVLSSAVSRLDGSEVLGLITYFVKWLEKYERFPEAGPCPLAGSLLGLSVCESVPSLESVVRGLGLVLDEHFYYLILNSQFHDDMRAIDKVVSSLASEAELCRPVDDIIKHLKLEVRKHEGL